MDLSPLILPLASLAVFGAVFGACGAAYRAYERERQRREWFARHGRQRHGYEQSEYDN